MQTRSQTRTTVKIIQKNLKSEIIPNLIMLELENLNLQNISQQSSDCNLVNK
jgi:hypothetical protein